MAIIMFDSILIVCTGNICRSPIGERYLRKALPHKKIDSAGTGALVGHAADESAIYISTKHGISLDGHLGRQLTPSLARKYDLILVMEKGISNRSAKLHLRLVGKQCYSDIGLINGKYLTLIAKAKKLLLLYIS